MREGKVWRNLSGFQLPSFVQGGQRTTSKMEKAAGVLLGEEKSGTPWGDGLDRLW